MVLEMKSFYGKTVSFCCSVFKFLCDSFGFIFASDE